MTSEFDAARLGPILYYRGLEQGSLRLAAMVLLPAGEQPGPLQADGRAYDPLRLRQIGENVIWRYDFTLSQDSGGYQFDGETYTVQTRVDGDLRIAFASCNGEEEGDLDRDQEERNKMWAHMCEEHRRAPFALLLQGATRSMPMRPRRATP